MPCRSQLVVACSADDMYNYSSYPSLLIFRGNSDPVNKCDYAEGHPGARTAPAAGARPSCLTHLWFSDMTYGMEWCRHSATERVLVFLADCWEFYGGGR